MADESFVIPSLASGFLLGASSFAVQQLDGVLAVDVPGQAKFRQHGRFAGPVSPPIAFYETFDMLGSRLVWLHDSGPFLLPARSGFGWVS